MLHIPLLRNGKQYTSLNQSEITDHRTGEVLATMSLANPGLITKDIRENKKVWHDLQKLSLDETLEMCKKAAGLFLNAEIPFANTTQTPEQFVKYQSASTGMPENMCRANMDKVHWVLTNLRDIIKSLSGRVDFSIIESGYGVQDGIPISFLPMARQLGAVLPSNSPGVHSLWVPSLALRVPVVLKPGSREPWTPFRLLHAFMEAGYPSEALSCYPTDYAGGNNIMLYCERAMIFGDDSTVRLWENDRRVEVHGTGFSKVLLGEDIVENWQEYMDVLFTSVMANGGRSCINTSAIWTPKYGREIADALAKRMVETRPLPLTHPQAELSAFSDKRMAEYMDHAIEVGLDTEGAEDVTAKYRQGERVEVCEKSTFLQPTLIHVNGYEHPLANREFMFPFTSVVEMPQEEMLKTIEKSLVVTAITNDPDWQRELSCCPHIDRLNIGPIPTCKVDWLQPHEGNLFEFLFQRRSFQKTP
ncbi:aldehyde dehydrogenase family protein [Candidatus Uabimicrobium amorphum]|uniref:Aldehyde dehydrogenase n=1 Tax=Uabimicrobium amorphum TaxID=2596890 RepID=A0A5S9IJW3_UABAM|nr:aldehyde dehydrogenase family protein [Candidatus Uabimicrobium amorphum]BBM82816.1 aldehyde dehydrogenase [Candidatus Uabimicrobium amorphum]